MACAECFVNVGRLHRPNCPRSGYAPEDAQVATINWREASNKGHVIQLYNDKNPWDSYFDIPLISHVTGNLYQGGVSQGYKLDDDFVKVVSLYQDERYILGPETERVNFEMFDHAEYEIDWHALDQASDEVLEGMQRGKTLVHCQAGLNRSGLVAAVTLMKLGWNAQAAIDFLRRSRCKFVLCNKTFVRQLHKLQHEWEDEYGVQNSLLDTSS